ncbi:MAG: lysylphosphatidylglycerol synthase domain-containing protein [bacterium]
MVFVFPQFQYTHGHQADLAALLTDQTVTLHRRDLQTILDFFPGLVWSTDFLFPFLLVLFLLPVNLMLEVYKWKILITKLEDISWWNATKAVLTGISVSMILPNRVGDYLGRVFVLEKADRLQAVLSTIIGSLAQLITTVLFGLLAVNMFFPAYYGFPDKLSVWIYVGLIIVSLVLMLLLVLTFLSFASFSDVIRRISGRFYEKVEKYAMVFSWYSLSDLLKVLLISIMRYVVFSFQFYLLLLAFGLSLPYFTAVMLIGLVYLAMTVIPTIALSELGVRGSVSMFIFAMYLKPIITWTDDIPLAVFSASGMLWIINLAFPALLGLMLVYSLRFFRKINGDRV